MERTLRNFVLFLAVARLAFAARVIRSATTKGRLAAATKLYQAAETGAIDARTEKPVTRSADVDHDEEQFGIFTGLEVRSDFSRAGFWGRTAKPITVRHPSNLSEPLAIAAHYNTETGVSDFVYYRVNADKFCVSCGRGSGWYNDEQLQLAREWSASDYATRVDYNGVGHFKLDRGHQAPVASFNEPDLGQADLTNMPTNLSPQSAFLNQNKWKYLEMDIRDKAAAEKEHAAEDDRTHNDIEVLTGPLYELPEAMFTATKAAQAWNEFLVSGKLKIDKNGQEKPAVVPLCPERSENNSLEFSDNLQGRNTTMKCEVDPDVLVPTDPRSNPNSLKIEFRSGSRRATPLRVPLGYFKLFTMEKGSRWGRQTCAFIMDQVGQCLVTSVEMLSKLAHIDLSNTSFVHDAGGLSANPPASEDFKRTTYVDPHWCVPPTGTLHRKQACLYKTNNVVDPEAVTTADIDSLWKYREEPETKRKTAPAPAPEKKFSSQPRCCQCKDGAVYCAPKGGCTCSKHGGKAGRAKDSVKPAVGKCAQTKDGKTSRGAHDGCKAAFA